MTVTGILLAAGASRRFGPDCKLRALYRGRPLVAHAAAAMAAACPARIAVIADPALAPLLEGFRIIRIPPGGQAASLRAGIAALHGGNALVALADMPHVTADLLRAVAARVGHDLPAAATDGQRPMPPACFPPAWFARLAALQGDRGAGALLRDLPPGQLIHAPPAALIDIDHPEDLP
ncbi:NTP transferase domain-containing protein [Falsirhodobacter algicola]|uniref:NTP transferase domain-containing protein n=1 Tax=Falsirhodobacter algicola TaxID=2692330 RepID=A0A8J8MUR6_9RHOB|nr:NTP transferase domain-containing protein [Falsirhodobacter algicola]QUS37081.1 NTP transferase domain-containing protein [Falsirhodobacter algicola]